MNAINHVARLTGTALLLVGLSACQSDAEVVDGAGTGTGATPAPEVFDFKLDASHPANFMADDAEHDAQSSEWWRYWPHLKTEDGREISANTFVLSTMQWQTLWFPWHQWRDLLIRTRFTDHQSQQVSTASSAWSDAPSPLDHAYELADFVGLNSTSGRGGDSALVVDLGEGRTLALEMSAPLPPVLNFTTSGAPGVHKFADGKELHMYQRQRMDTVGYLTEADGKRSRVSGTTWFEHAWTNEPAFADASWDYIQMELKDGRNVQLMHARSGRPGSSDLFWQGQIQSPDGSIDYLDKSEMAITPQSYWTAPGRDGKCQYPAVVRVRVQGQDFTLTPAAPDQEVGNLWDGHMAVTGDGSGHGVAEYRNYCDARPSGV